MCRTLIMLPLGAGLCALLAPAISNAVTLTLQSEQTPHPGLTVQEYRTSSPAANLWVAYVDLCSDYVHMTATAAPSSLKTTGSWAAGQGLQLATNGDFYKTGPVRVYGNAVGNGTPWPVNQTGDDPGHSWEWFYQRYGWIAFGPGWVDFTHSEWVKNNAAAFGLSEGWQNQTVAPAPPPGTLALVSGFPELVVEGQKITCPSATDSSCFPDRSDMRSRHPRTAMGLSADRKTFILAVVDGRTSSSSGMYGLELADTMQQLGAWVAFNLDGGGSSQMWREGSGYVNNYSGNNSGGGARSVANHWGVFAGAASGEPQRPGHCVDIAPCETIAASGGVIDDSSSCFRTFGPSAYWREESAGRGGHLYWTNAFTSSQPSNWATWQLHLGEAGEYLVEHYATAGYSLYGAAPYAVIARGAEARLTVDQGAGTGWQPIGVFTFDAGGRQQIAVFDNTSGSVASGQRITADAVRLTRLDPWCGDGECNGAEACDICADDCGACPSCGDGECNSGESCDTCIDDCGVCPPLCGDGVCNSAETCTDCADDCGACPPVCGDGECNGAETCDTCADDCSACPPVCGDGECNGAETCDRCADDCGACPPVCGDAICTGDESCADCSVDCGDCPPTCGDGLCRSTPGEDCATCPVDCGECPAACNDCESAEGHAVDEADLDLVATIGCSANDGSAGAGLAMLLGLFAAFARRHRHSDRWR